MRPCSLPASLLALVLALAPVRSAGAQAVLGSWSTTSPKGTKVSLVLQRDGDGVTGALRDATSSLLVEGKLQGDAVVGVLRGSGGAVLFEARPDGNGVAVTLAVPNAWGQPDASRSQRLAFAREGAATPGRERPSGGAPGSARTAQDRQLLELLQSRAWCWMHFSSSGTYTGGSGSTTTTTRSVFLPDGTAIETTGGETVNSGSAGRAWGSGSNEKRGFYRVEDGALWLSADGRQWARQPIQVYDNGAGYPIVKANGREYSGCR